jgi:predicted amidohydrolase YtcJ
VPHREADLVLTNANVITVDPQERVAHSVAVRDGRIVAVDDTKDWIGPETRVVDLQGRTVLPGFIDSHTHVDGMADVEAHTVNIQVPPLAGPDAIIARLKELQKKLGPGAWLHGNGTYNQVMPTREQLDAAFPDSPVRLDWSVHDNVINHAAAVALKLDSTYPDPPAGSTGRLERTADGEVKIIRDYHVPFPVETFTHAEKKQALEDILQKFYLERGVTTVSDMAITGPDTFQAYQELRDEGKLPARVRMNPLFNKPGQTGGMLSTGWHTGLGNDMLSIGAIKFVLDGVWGTTAAVYKPFWNGSGTTWIANNRGGTSFTQDQLTSEVVAAHKAGWQVQIHANGDRAQDMALTAFEAAQAAAPARRPGPHRTFRPFPGAGRTHGTASGADEGGWRDSVDAAGVPVASDERQCEGTGREVLRAADADRCRDAPAGRRRHDRHPEFRDLPFVLHPAPWCVTPNMAR